MKSKIKNRLILCIIAIVLSLLGAFIHFGGLIIALVLMIFIMVDALKYIVKERPEIFIKKKI